MASHRRRTVNFSRASKPRLALLRGMMTSLVEHGRIKTTVDRAKEVRRHIEKAITVGKKGDVAATRLLMSRIPNKNAVKAIVSDISVRFKTRPGGYTRIIKIGRRPGDTAEMAFLEFVDYDWTKVGKTEGTAAEVKAAKKEKIVRSGRSRRLSRRNEKMLRISKRNRGLNRAVDPAFAPDLCWLNFVEAQGVILGPFAFLGPHR